MLFAFECNRAGRGYSIPGINYSQKMVTVNVSTITFICWRIETVVLP